MKFNSFLLKFCTFCIFVQLSIQNDSYYSSPVLIHSKRHEIDKGFTLGKVMEPSEFQDKLSKAFPNKAIKIILCDIELENLETFIGNLIEGHQNTITDEQGKIANSHLHFGYFPLVNNPHEETKKHFHNKFKIETANTEDELKNHLKSVSPDIHYDGAVVIFHEPITRHKTHSISKRQLSNFYSNGVYTIYGKQCAATFSSIYVKNSTLEIIATYELLIKSASFNCTDNATAILTFDFDVQANITTEQITKIEFEFVKGYRNWLLQNTSVITTLKSDPSTAFKLKYDGLPYGFETPFQYSYACTTSKFYVVNAIKPRPNSKIEMFFNEFQIQPFDLNPINSTIYAFGPVNYCLGFFSNGIWMGIVTSLLLGFILIMGLATLMSINTMDRFDDPKGKQLTIAAEK